MLFRSSHQAHKQPLYDIGKNGLEGIGTAIASDGHLKFFSGRQGAVVADKLSYFITVYLIRRIAERLQQGECQDGEKNSRIKYCVERKRCLDVCMS